MPRDVEQDAGGGRADEERGASEADEREGQPLGRQDGEGDGEVEQRLDAEHRRDAEGQVAAVIVGGTQGGAHAAGDEEQVRAAEERDAGEPELLADDGGHEVGVRLRQVERLEAAAEPDAEGAARPEGDDRLEGLVGDVLLVLLHVDPGQVALVAVPAEADGRGAEPEPQERRAEQVPELRPRDEEQDEGHEQEHDGAAEVLLGHAEKHEQAGHEQVREEPDGEVPHLLGLLRERVGEPDDDGELGDLGGLDVDRADGQPARRAPRGVTEADDARDGEDAGEGEERVGELVEPVVVEPADGEEGDQGGGRVGCLTLQEELRVVVLDGRLHGGRAVDHDDAEADERDRDRREHGVHRRVREALVGVRVERGEELHRRPADVLLRPLGGPHAGVPSASAWTSRTNSSPRCL